MGDMLYSNRKAQQDFDEKKNEEMTKKLKIIVLILMTSLIKWPKLVNMGHIEDIIKMNSKA